MRLMRAFGLAALILVLVDTSSEAGWLIYHKPAFKGKVIDAETKKPIEGAVVVVVYEKGNWNGPGGGYTSAVKVKETLTDKNGEFKFPSYTTLILPFLSEESDAVFLIYKPGYGYFAPHGISVPDMEIFFSQGFGEMRDIKILWGTEQLEGYIPKWVRIPFGIVELLKLKTREERLNAITYPYGDVKSKDIRLLYKAINEERRRFGLEAVGEGD